MVVRSVKKYLYMFASLLLSQPTFSADGESIVMDAPSGSELISSENARNIETYSYRVYDHSVVGENGVLIQQVMPGTRDSGSSELINRLLPADSSVCESGAWGAYEPNKRSSSGVIYERYCKGHSNDGLYGYQASMWLTGNEKTFLVTFIWTVSPKVSIKERSESIKVISDETSRYLNSIRVCDSPGYDPCQDSVDQHLNQRAKDYLDNRI